MTDGLQILAQTVISSNLILVQGLGLYALTRYTKSVREAAGAGVKTLAGMLIGSILLWLLSPIVPSSPAPQVGFYLLVGLVASLAASKLVMETSGTDQAVDGALVVFSCCWVAVTRWASEHLDIQCRVGFPGSSRCRHRAQTFGSGAHTQTPAGTAHTSDHGWPAGYGPAGIQVLSLSAPAKHQLLGSAFSRPNKISEKEGIE